MSSLVDIYYLFCIFLEIYIFIVQVSSLQKLGFEQNGSYFYRVKVGKLCIVKLYKVLSNEEFVKKSIIMFMSLILGII